jgi:S1-C subfamily serine protease
MLAGVIALVAGLAISWGLLPARSGRTAAATHRAPVSSAAVKSRLDPAIVDVASMLGDDSGEASGTGIVLTSTGQVLTNNHVIDGATTIRVTDIGNGRPYTATVVGYDRSADVAVLQLQGASGLKAASIGDSSKVATGETVMALGNAGGAGGTPSASTGAVTALNQSVLASDTATGSSELLSGLIESNANLQAGDSGGPLVNSGGQVVAMDSAASGDIHTQSGSNRTRSYSIPINRAVRLAHQIQAGHSSSQVHIGATGVLGVAVRTTGGYQANMLLGIQVADVPSGSPAARSGLEAGAIITSVGGKPVGTASALSGILSRYHPGDEVAVDWTDQVGQTHRSAVVLTTGPAA